MNQSPPWCKREAKLLVKVKQHIHAWAEVLAEFIKTVSTDSSLICESSAYRRDQSKQVDDLQTAKRGLFIRDTEFMAKFLVWGLLARVLSELIVISKR